LLQLNFDVQVIPTRSSAKWPRYALC